LITHSTWGIYTKLKQLTPYFTNLKFEYFVKPFWKHFKKFFTKKLGTSISNLSKSFFYWTYINLLQNLTHLKKNNKKIKSPTPSVIYMYPNTLIPFSFNVKTYNVLVFFIITMLTTFYNPNRTEFKLYYSFIWRPVNLLNYNFLTRFYFKIKNY
jgi:hypothetical protein